MKTLNAKSLVAMSLSLLLGFACGYLTKDWLDNKNAATQVPVHKVQDSLMSNNRLIAPNLWDIYIDPFWTPSAIPELVSLPTAMPRVQMVDGAKEFRVIVPARGLTEKDVDVQVCKDALTIKGFKKEEQNGRDNGLRSLEEAFEQTIELPCKIDADKVRATIKNGVLTVSLPKVATSVAISK